MSLGSGSLNIFVFRLSAIALSLVLSGEVAALGLGELRSMPSLGERPRLEVELIGVGKDTLDPSCFRLRLPASGDDLPWLKRATFSIRKGVPPILEIRSDSPLRDPILQLSIQIACGHEIVRDYMILASPEPATPPSAREPAVRVPQVRQPLDEVDVQPRRGRAAGRAKPAPPREPQLQPVTPRRAESRAGSSGMADRLMLSAGGDAGEPSLRLATELGSQIATARQIGEAQREVLRLEFRTLLALNEQATTQLAAVEKLRNLEASLSELQRRASEITQKVEQGVATPALPVVPEKPDPAASGAPTVMPVQPATPVKPVQGKAPTAPPPPEESLLSEWSLYGLLLAGLLGVGTWLGWRNYRERKELVTGEELALIPPEFEVDPQRVDEHEELGGVDLHVDPVAMGGPMQVDFPLDSDEVIPEATVPQRPALPPGYDSMMSIAAATVDEHFEANPVMELADIMLSFGRVKGAAQALQEYIDHNPQEALQPWIRLMDVYRMAGLREEFDKVARNLNQHFNVEIQQWDPAEPTLNRHTIDMVLDDDLGEIVQSAPPAPRAESIEEMPRLLRQIIELWREGDVLAYLQQLLRDNRGGKRSGFSLNVVEEILFLIDLKETLNKT
jgi:pilus assembly protein FimV